MKGISLINGKTEPPPPPGKRSAAEEAEQAKIAAPAAGPPEPSAPEKFELLHPKVVPRLIINSAFWFVVSFSYYGLSLFPPPPLFDPTTIKYAAVIDWCFGFAVEFPAYYFSGFLIERPKIGRKGACAGSIFISGMLLSIAGTQPQEQLSDTLVIVYACLYYVARGFLAAGFGVIYPWSAELYPTSIRSSAVGFNSFWARLGSSLAPQAGEVTPFSLRMSIFGVPTMIVAALALVVLPETRGKPLPGSVDDL